MGLDISAYRRVTKLDVIFDEDGEAIDKETHEYVDCDVRVFANPDFPGRAEGVEHRAAYKAQESMGFRADSYSGYNAWRNELAKLAGYPKTPYETYGNVRVGHDAGAWAAEKGPFWELINFSDCEGTIGPVVSAKLAKDFSEWDERAKQYDQDNALDGYFYKRLQEWRQAFEMASDGGLVDFH